MFNSVWYNYSYSDKSIKIVCSLILEKMVKLYLNKEENTCVQLLL